MIRGGEVIDKKGCTSELTGRPIYYESETPIQLSRGEIRGGGERREIKCGRF